MLTHDEVFHMAYTAPVNYKPIRVSDCDYVKCNNCNDELKVYYCENRIYAVKCDCCKTIMMVSAGSPLDAVRYAGWLDEEVHYDA